MRTLLALALLVSVAAPARADNVGCDPAGAQAQLDACAAQDLRKADAELNTIYRQIMAKLVKQPLALDKLKTAQRLWVQLRDADLEARYPAGNHRSPQMLYGSMYPTLYASTKAELTAARTAYLRATFLERREGDL
ncbi:lysozyme inhibitor LprI family protein [Xanthomonas albilineans]|uniref:lysozyme inhibitor LprI family protein n=1 Tax=Xanthomonas albilineans TaxID=29447 RepID=UPI0005F33067|nr:lysozyme inhibitor LprI family protein [Xanthomonas albilineans]